MPSETREDWIVREARKRPPAKRAAFLDGACTGDLMLRQRIEALLIEREQGDTGTATACDVDRAAVDVGFGARSDQSVGQLLGRYKVLQKIGEGGCGSVYMAEQEQPVRRRVALKVIKLGMDTKVVIARFEAERQALALMDHPNIAKVLDAGATEAGRPYFVMELVRGIRFTEYCDQNHLGTRTRLELFIQICHAIQHAHQKGIIHRDIKPSNILVTLQDGMPVPKVIDFGIAKATTDQRLTDKTLFTTYEQFIGTPAYMSPEQAEMSGLDVDTRSDIYSLGVLLYELLTGKTPFDPKELVESGLEAMRRIIREKDPLRPSTKLHTLSGEELTMTAKRYGVEVPRLVSQLRGDLDWIVMKCLEKDRTRRYETANGLAMDLKRHLRNEPVIARPPSTCYRVQKAFSRNKVAFSSAIIVALALMVGAAVSIWQAIRAKHLRQEAEQARAHAQANAARAETGERIAKQAAAALRRRSYAADMKAAQVAIQQNSLGQAVRLLANYVPVRGEQEEDLRSVEWRYLWGSVRGDQVATWNVGDGLVNWVRSTPDAKYVLSATVGRRIKVHDAQSGKVVRQLDTICEGPSFTPSLSGDGRFVSFVGDGVLSFYEAPDWNLVLRKRLPEAKSSTCQTCLSPTGELLAVGLPDGIRILETKTWNSRVPDIAEHKVSRMQFTSDGTRLIYSHSEGEIRVCNLVSSKECKGFSLTKPGSFLSLDPTERFVTTMEGQSVTLCRFETLEPVWTATNLHSAAIASATFSKDGQMLATASFDQTIALVRVRDGMLMGRLRGHQNELWDVSPAADENYLLSASKDGTIKHWRWTPPEKPSIHLASNEVVIPSIRAGDSLLTLDRDKRVFSTWNRLERASWAVPSSLGSVLELSSNVVEVAETSIGQPPGFYHADAKRLLILTARTGLTIYRSEDGALDRRFQVPVENTKNWAASLDLRWLAEVARDVPMRPQTLRVWDLGTGRMMHAFKAISGLWFARQAAFSPDSKLLAFPNEDHDIILWNLSEDREERRLKGALWHLNRVCFSPSGKHLAAGGWEGVVYLWNTLDGRLATPPMHGHGSGVMEVCFSLDGRTLLSSGDDNTVRFWSTAAGLEMLRLDRAFSWQPLWANDSLLQRTESRDGRGPCILEAVSSVEEIRVSELRAPLVSDR